MALLYLLHLSESTFDTQTTAVVNSAPGGLVFQNLGIGTDPGGRFWFAGEGPFGQGLNTEGLDGARTCITSTTQVTLAGAFCFEGFASDFNDYGTDLVSFSVNGTDDGLMRIRVEMHDGVAEGAYKLICYAQVGGPGTGFLAFETGDILPLAGVAGMPSGFHWALTRSAAGYLAMYANGARQALATTAIPGSLTGYIEPFGSRNRVNNDSNGGYQLVIGELRGTDGSEVYTGTTYTVPTARFASITGAAAQTLGGVVSAAAAKAVVRVPGGGTVGAFDSAVFDATVFDVGAINAQTLGAITQVATATGAAAARQATAAQTLGGVSQTATATTPAKATAGQTLGGIVPAATATAPAKASAAQTLGGVTQAAVVSAPAKASAAQTLSGVSQSVTLSTPARASAAQTLGGVTQAATALAIGPGLIATQTLEGIIQTAAATGTPHAAATQALGSITQSATALAVLDTRYVPGGVVSGPPNTATTFSQFRVYMTAALPSADGYMNLGKIEFFKWGVRSGLPTNVVATDASSSFPARGPENLFNAAAAADGQWTSDGALPHWVSVKYASPIDVDTIVITPSTEQPNNRSPKDFVIQGRNSDGDSWETIYTASETDWSAPHSYTVNDYGPAPIRVGHRYWAMDATSTVSDSYMALQEIELYEATGPNQASIGTATATSYYGSNTAQRAIDGDYADGGNGCWVSDGTSPVQRWQVDMGVKYAFTHVVMFPQNFGGANGRGPKDFKWQWSDDGITWVDTKVVTDETTWAQGVGITYTFDATYEAGDVLSQTLGGIIPAATATVTDVDTRLVSAAQTLGPITQAAALTSAMHLDAAQTLGGITQAAAVSVLPLSGISAFQVLGGPVSAATAKVLARAAAAQAMGGISSQAAAVVLAVRLAAASQTLGGIGQSATASLAARASAAQTMAGVLASAQLSSALALAGAQQLGGIVPAATAVVSDTVFRLQAAQILGAIQQFARIQHDYVFVRDERTFVVNPSDRTHVVGASNRSFIIAPADRTFAVAPSNRTLIVE